MKLILACLLLVCITLQTANSLETDDAIVEDMRNAYNSLKNGASWMANKIENMMPSLDGMLEDIEETIEDAAGEMGDSMSDAVSDIIETIDDHT